jgi:hypothetical protein
MLQVPCAQVRDARLLLQGKGKARIYGLWRAARILTC